MGEYNAFCLLFQMKKNFSKAAEEMKSLEILNPQGQAQIHILYDVYGLGLLHILLLLYLRDDKL